VAFSLTQRHWPPAADEPERLRLSVEVRTGYTVNDQGRTQRLTEDQRLERQRQLQALGGPCDVRRWEDLSAAELAQVRSP
jgi:hypothetical protein